MVQIEYLPIVLTGLGLTASVLYYSMVLRNANKARELTLFMQIYRDLTSPETIRRHMTLLLEMEWDDYYDFEKKYGTTYGNLDNYSQRYASWKMYDGIGVLLQNNLIDPKLVYQLLGQTEVIHTWDKFGEIIVKQRELLNLPDWFVGFEYLYDEMMRIRIEKGHSTEIAEKYGSALYDPNDQ